MSETLSAPAQVLLRLHVDRMGDIPVDDSNRDSYWELARAGLMVVGHSFTGGREAFYTLTELGKKTVTALKRMAASPLP